eukprot:jgi/Mesen1/5756/ME000292S04843
MALETRRNSTTACMFQHATLSLSKGEVYHKKKLMLLETMGHCSSSLCNASFCCSKPTPGTQLSSEPKRMRGLGRALATSSSRRQLEGSKHLEVGDEGAHGLGAEVAERGALDGLAVRVDAALARNRLGRVQVVSSHHAHLQHWDIVSERDGRQAAISAQRGGDEEQLYTDLTLGADHLVAHADDDLGRALPPPPGSFTTTPMRLRLELKGSTCTICTRSRTALKLPPNSRPRFRMAVSVGVPMTLTFTDPSGCLCSSTSPLEFVNMLSRTTSLTFHVVTTVILLAVSVPVLSLQMVVADPMVSHAASLRTRALSAIMRFMAKASVSVTARGSPSGTATTMMVTATAKKYLLEQEEDEILAPPCTQHDPHRLRPTTVCKGGAAEEDARTWRGVSSSPVSLSVAIRWPHSVFMPTPVANSTAPPSCTLVPDSRNGEATYLERLLVIADSCDEDDDDDREGDAPAVVPALLPAFGGDADGEREGGTEGEDPQGHVLSTHMTPMTACEILQA